MLKGFILSSKENNQILIKNYFTIKKEDVIKYFRIF